jgi:uncharacterized protein (DUF362 family)
LLIALKGKDVEAMANEAIDLTGGIESIVKPGNVVLIKNQVATGLRPVRPTS